MKPVVIVGSGLAGYTTAREFCKHDRDTPLVIVTADDGASYSKPMLSTAFARGKTPASLAQAPATQMAEQLGAEIRTGRRVAALDAGDRVLTLDDGSVIEAARIVLGTGARQAEPRLAGDAAGEVFAVNNLLAYGRLHQALADARRVVLIGGGLIGCEFANDWINAGYEVTVIEPCAWPMGTLLPPVAGGHLQRALTDAGIDLRLGRAATAVEHSASGLRVHDDAGEVHAADVVVRAIGLRPDLDLARAAGLTVNRGIVTDRALETSAPGIHALGDCAEIDGVWLPFILPINHCGRALGATLAGERTEVEYPVMPVIVKTPACPVQLYAPPAGTDGEWTEEAAADGTRGMFRDHAGRARGFVLTGAAVQEKAEYARQVPGYFANRG